MDHSDLTGRKFGKWTVVKRQGSEERQSMWLCRCTCGNEGRVPRVRLTSGKSQGCAVTYKIMLYLVVDYAIAGKAICEKLIFFSMYGG